MTTFLYLNWRYLPCTRMHTYARAKFQGISTRNEIIRPYMVQYLHCKVLKFLVESVESGIPSWYPRYDVSSYRTWVRCVMACSRGSSLLHLLNRHGIRAVVAIKFHLGHGSPGYYGRNAESFTSGPLDISIVCMTTRNKTVDLQIMGQGWAVSPPFLFKHLLCMFLRILRMF